jgi:hypothetical protein
MRLNGNVRIASRQRYAAEVGIEFNPAQNGNRRSARNGFGNVLDRFVQIFFRNGQFHHVTPTIFMKISELETKETIRVRLGRWMR